MLRISAGVAWRRVAVPLCAARPNPAAAVRCFSAGHAGGSDNWLSHKLQKKVAKLGMVDKVKKAAEAGELEAMTLMGAACAMGNQVQPMSCGPISLLKHGGLFQKPSLVFLSLSGCPSL